MDFVGLFLWQKNITRYKQKNPSSCWGDECLVEEHTQQPHTKKQPCLIVTTPKHYPRKKRSVFDIHHLVSQYWVYMSWSPWWLGFIRLNTHSQTDGQLFVRSQANYSGQIIADSVLCSEFKQGHLCSTVTGINVTLSACLLYECATLILLLIS